MTIAAFIVLERTSYPPDDDADEDEIRGYMIDEWRYISVHDATPRRGKCRGDNEEAEAVRHEIDMAGLGTVLFGDMLENIPKEITRTTEKVLLAGKMRWVPVGISDWDGGTEYGGEFTIESARVLKEYSEPYAKEEYQPS